MEDSLEFLKKKLWNLAEKTLESEEHKDEFRYLLDRFNLSKEEILEMVMKYTFSRDITNAEYASIAMRVVLHLHNLIPGSYHQKK